MGLFDFPRIHFKGNIDLNVPTINNSYYFPLTLYDQTRSRAFLPPRLYFTNADIPQKVSARIKPIVKEDPITALNRNRTNPYYSPAKNLVPYPFGNCPYSTGQ